MIGDKGMFGGVCVDIIHTEEYGHGRTKGDLIEQKTGKKIP